MILTEPALLDKKEQFDSIYLNLHQSIRAHSTHVGILTGILAKQVQAQISEIYNLSGIFETAILHGGVYHDIGKHLLSYSICKKSGPLKGAEQDAMHRHPVYTGKLLTEYADVLFEHEGEKQLAMDMGIYHHEHYDGGGYPGGLSEKKIPLIAQLCALANTLDNEIFVGRRRNMPFAPAAENIIKNNGVWFSPEAVACFTQSADAIRRLYENKHSWIRAGV